jgi:hypothetical protein
MHSNVQQYSTVCRVKMTLFCFSWVVFVIYNSGEN